MEDCTTPDARARPGTERWEDVEREETEALGVWDQGEGEGEGRREGSPSWKAAEEDDETGSTSD